MIVKHILVGSLIVRYIPVGLLEVPPQRINEKPPHYVGRNDLETLMASRNSEDWVKLRSVPGLDAHERNFLRFFISFVAGCSSYYSGKIQFERDAGCYVYFTLSLIVTLTVEIMQSITGYSRLKMFPCVEVVHVELA